MSDLLQQAVASGQVPPCKYPDSPVYDWSTGELKAIYAQAELKSWRDVTDAELESLVGHWGTDSRQACLDLAALLKHKNPSHYTPPSTNISGEVTDAELAGYWESHLRYCDRNIAACEAKGDAANLDWWRKWKLDLHSRAAIASQKGAV